MRILIIDDERFLCQTIADFFEDMGYECETAFDGRQGVQAFEATQPDVVLCDLNMPQLDGFGVLDAITHKSPETPVIVVSGVGVIADAVRAVRHGAWDFVTKPIRDMNVLEHRVSKALERADLLRQNRRYREHLEEEVKKRTADLRKEANERLEAQHKVQVLNEEIIHTQKELIMLLGDVVEHRSKETANHVRRVAEISYLLAIKSGMDKTEAETLRLASPMHDVGKIAIPDSILNKPARLTTEEFEIIKSHTLIGFEILNHSKRRIMKAAAITALQHHERWDGKGYPHGLAGEDIHVYGRITCIADVFDALTQKRIYKDAWPLDKVLDMYRKQSGLQFDPHLTDILLNSTDEISAITTRYPDSSQS
ncbi:HD domain-containing phosphohydrolase [Desulfovibrio ferrophilus]|uniref:Response regulator receiver modulated metal dependent phosphohydrolase n=1 Tax=Desulfovibrio ferrophilus TaxID=241368 RepID=A0A2Z6B132_9BACT|nr:HD domain-containing phosphohydrolase [Desulfovibrio ferrophilus]BBD09184.1 response regulator receiver modulated metal dependent phosphohydrolase [Desulfovibrio ferrophilus]